MGYFAVLQPPGGPTFSVAACHLNVWVVPGLLPGRKLVFLDVGLRIKAGLLDLPGFEVAIPSELDEANWPGRKGPMLDLHDRLLDQASAELVFGGPVEQSDVGGLRILSVADGPDFPLAEIDPENVAKADVQSHRSDFSVWSVPLRRPIPAGEEGYVRFRCRLAGSHVWTWQRTLGVFRAGATLSFRVNDVREAEHPEMARTVRDKAIPIGRVDFFAIAPRRLLPDLASPAVRYRRLLEGRVWRGYLADTAYGGRGLDLTVHYWRSDETRPVDNNCPFRVLMVASRRAGANPSARLVSTVIAVLVALGLDRLTASDAARFGRDVLPSVWLFGKAFVPTSVLAFSGLLALVARLTRNHGRGPRMALRGVERRILAAVKPTG